MANLYEKVATAFRHGQFQLVPRNGGHDIVGTRSYKGEYMGTVSTKWPHRVRKTNWRKRKKSKGKRRR